MTKPLYRRLALLSLLSLPLLAITPGQAADEVPVDWPQAAMAVVQRAEASSVAAA